MLVELPPFTIKDKLWRYPGPHGWIFVTMNQEKSEFLKSLDGLGKINRGLIKVRATLGQTTWETSLLPQKDGPYLLAVKAAVRKKEQVDEGDEVEIVCEVL